MQFLGINLEAYESTISMLKMTRENHWDFNPLEAEAKIILDAHRSLLKQWVLIRVGVPELDLYSSDPTRLVSLYKQLEKVANGEGRVTFSVSDTDFLITDHLNLLDIISQAKYGVDADGLMKIQKARDAMMNKFLNGGGLFGDGGDGQV